MNIINENNNLHVYFNKKNDFEKFTSSNVNAD